MEWSLRLLELLRSWWRLNRSLWLTLAHWLSTFFDICHILTFFSFSFNSSIEYLKDRSDNRLDENKD